MKTVHIHFPSKGQPTVDPDPQGCLSDETLLFVISSDNPYIEAVNLAFDDTSANILICPGSTVRQYYCKIDLQEIPDGGGQRTGTIWGVALTHTAEEPKSLKYTITPFVLGNRYGDGEIDPYIIIIKRPFTDQSTSGGE